MIAKIIRKFKGVKLSHFEITITTTTICNRSVINEHDSRADKLILTEELKDKDGLLITLAHRLKYVNAILIKCFKLKHLFIGRSIH